MEKESKITNIIEGLKQIKRLLEFCNSEYGIYEKRIERVGNEEYLEVCKKYGMAKCIFESDMEILQNAIDMLSTQK